MELMDILAKLKDDHRIIEDVLHNSIAILIGYKEDVYLKERSSFFSQVRQFIRNYDKLVVRHYEFEETYLYPDLVDEYGDEAMILLEEHRRLVKYRDRVKELVEEGDLKGVLETLRSLYDLAREHLNRETNLLKKYISDKGVPLSID